MIDLKVLLTKILDALKVDYVVAEGTDGVWTYCKWASGRYEATYNGGYTLNAGTAWQGGYFHETTYGLTLPSFALTWRLKSAIKNDGVLAYCVGIVERNDGLHLIWVNGVAAAASGSAFGDATTTITGTWK